ncbi:GNAT family N-acetyltransferase [Zavarzinia sp. CC-PAN008]|uniref:GNAT family N-acetyltransferase n=1 Tax=Zavarzinia sp. CC-PAN008 TaxID=3243332 RepID=UPI003F747FC5
MVNAAERAPAPRVRTFRRSDAAAVWALLAGLARHVEDPDPDLDPSVLCAWLLGPTRLAQGLVAVDGGQVVGVALHAPMIEGHTGRRFLYLSDLAVAEAARGRGAGVALMAALAALVLARGLDGLKWTVWERNALALAVYGRLGGEQIASEQLWQITGPALRSLAKRAPG